MNNEHLITMNLSDKEEAEVEKYVVPLMKCLVMNILKDLSKFKTSNEITHALFSELLPSVIVTSYMYGIAHATKHLAIDAQYQSLKPLIDRALQCQDHINALNAKDKKDSNGGIDFSSFDLVNLTSH